MIMKTIKLKSSNNDCFFQAIRDHSRSIFSNFSIQWKSGVGVDFQSVSIEIYSI